MTRRSNAAVAASVVVGLGICGALLGSLWAWVAPATHTFVGLTKSGERVDGFIGKEADNQFVAVAIMVGLLTFLAIVSAVLVWQWRMRRGPVLAAVLWIGQVVAAAAAIGTGAALAHWRYGTPDRNVALSPDNRVAYFTEAPPVVPGHHPLQIAVTLLLPAAVAAMAYAFLAVANPRDDLGVPPVVTPNTTTGDGTEPVLRA